MILDLKPSIKQPKGFWIQGWHSWYITNRPAHIHWLCEYFSNYMPTLIWFQRNIRYLSPTKWNIKLMLISVGSPCINHKYCSIVKTSISMVSESESLYLNLCLKYKYHNLWYVFAVFWFNFCCFIFFRPQSWADELESLESNLTISLVESIFNAMFGACLAPV